jgi:hypothetical protein
MIAPYRNDGRNPRPRTGAQAQALREAPEDRAALRPALRLQSLGGPPRRSWRTTSAWRSWGASSSCQGIGEMGSGNIPSVASIRGESDGDTTSKVLQQTDAPASDTC